MKMNDNYKETLLRVMSFTDNLDVLAINSLVLIHAYASIIRIYGKLNGIPLFYYILERQSVHKCVCVCDYTFTKILVVPCSIESHITEVI